jgi:23S rRNA (guanine745-N1)-methyltransferase
VLAVVVPDLACPYCAGAVTLDGPVVRCRGGHAFDVARQGYVALLPSGSTAAGDTAEMVGARERFLGTGHYARIADAVAQATIPGCTVEIGAGTGYYLKAALATGRGIGVDASKYAARRLAKAHPNIGAVVADAWRRLPIKDGVASSVLDVFAPRNGSEIHRILGHRGRLVVVTPTADHLRELATTLRVDEHKQQRLAATLGPYFELDGSQELTWGMELEPAETAALIGMGPNAFHQPVEPPPGRLNVTASVRVSAYRRRG